MTTLADALARVDTITFDCYGTLIDWHGGLLAAFAELFGEAFEGREAELCAAYRRLEAEVQADRQSLLPGQFRSYRDVLGEVSKRLGREIEITLPAGDEKILADRLPAWKPFADTNEALCRLKKRYRLGVLSNIDRDLFAETASHFDVTMDFVITAEDVEAYKPSRAHFERAISQCGEGKILHVAESLFHDGAPANELGIPYVWINRYKAENVTNVQPLAEFSDLASLANEV